MNSYEKQVWLLQIAVKMAHTAKAKREARKALRTFKADYLAELEASWIESIESVAARVSP